MKKILLSLFVLGLSFLSFSNAGSYTFTGSVSNSFSNYADILALPIPLVDYNSCKAIGLSCTFTNVSNNGFVRAKLYYSYSSYTITNKFINTDLGNDFLLDNGTVNMTLSSVACNRFIYFSISNYGGDVFNFKYSCTFSGDNVSDSGGSSCPECEVCTPQYTSQECQSEYNLIPISDIDSNYCTENDLCTFTGSYSNLVINDIWHESKPFIYVNIPEEIDWDYTGNSYSFTLDVGGYNTDSDYIEGIITTQKFTPDSSDFQKIITDVLPLFVPGLVIILFIYYIFRLIKKLF